MSDDAFVLINGASEEEDPGNPEVPILRPRHYLVSPTLCVCGETIPEGDTVCPRDPSGSDLEHEVAEFIQRRMM